MTPGRLTTANEPASSLIQPEDGNSWWRRLLGGTRRLRERADWVQFAGPDWADHILQAQVTDDFHAKQGRSTGRWVLESEGRTLAVYLKRHYRLPWWQGLLATLWPGGDWSPAFQEYHHLQWARAQGLPVPRVVAAGEYLRPLAKLQSFLAIEELTGMLALHQAIPLAACQMEVNEFRRWKVGLVQEMARLTRFLHDRRYFHKDLYLCHFYIPRADTSAGCAPSWLGRVHMIDFHRLGRHPWTWPWWRLKDLAQLLFSSDLAGVTVRDRLLFWRFYLAPDGRRSAPRLSWFVRRKADRYRRHNEKKD
jgi:Lipopolysaccharide kinase (Kdo/WaaP) family